MITSHSVAHEGIQAITEGGVGGLTFEAHILKSRRGGAVYGLLSAKEQMK